MKPKDVYISTPVSSRKEGTERKRRKAAIRRVAELEALWTKTRPADYLTHHFYSFVNVTEEGMTDAQAMGACIKKMLECDVVLVDDVAAALTDSKGVMAEREVANIYGIDIVLVPDLLEEMEEDEK